MFLSQMKENEVCKIIKISENCSLKNRLNELGIISGQKIECKNIGINRSPIAYQICSGKLAIRKKDAQNIEVAQI